MGSTFDNLRLDDHYLHFTFMVVVLVVLSAILEFVIHLISSRVKKMKYRYMGDIVNCVYKELMVLGIVGALLFIANETNVLNFAIGSEEESNEVIEFVHFMLFMIGVLYIMLVGVALILVIKRSYLTWGKQEDLYDAFFTLSVPEGKLKWYHPITRFNEYQRRKTVSYYNIRQEFIAYNELPEDFDFARYLRKCMRNKIVEMLHIDKYMWGFLLLIVLFNALRVKTSGDLSTAASVTIGSLMAWGLLAVYILIFLYCAHVLWSVIDLKGGFNGEEKRNEDIKQLFLLRRPHLVLRAIQISTFLQAFYLSLFSLAFAPDIVNDSPKSVSWLAFIFTLLPPFISVGLFLPQIYPIYVLTCSVHNLSDKRVINATFKEVIKASKIKTEGYSYAEEWQMEKQWRGTMRILSTVFDDPAEINQPEEDDTSSFYSPASSVRLSPTTTTTLQPPPPPYEPPPPTSSSSSSFSKTRPRPPPASRPPAPKRPPPSHPSSTLSSSSSTTTTTTTLRQPLLPAEQEIQEDEEEQ